MAQKEAQARIRINELLSQAGWRFFDSEEGRANIRLEPGVKYQDLGVDFERTKDGYIDFLLLDKDGRPLVVVEAKRESIDPLSAKEQARNYARNSGARFIILSNGNIHYLWDTKQGNPEVITRFPTQDSISQYEDYHPNPQELASTEVDEYYIVESQEVTYQNDPDFKDESRRDEYLAQHQLKRLRPYQIQAVQSLQEAAKNGSNRFLFEMATGTGKTLTAAAIIKLFLKTGNARRVLFLVDRLELEDQAGKAFKNYLGRDFTCVIYKEKKDSWQKADIVVSTIQTFLAGDRYRKEFSPTDFEFVISDEAHRSISGNSRAVFEYFVGYKLGLTATPKDYLKGFDKDSPDTQREFERRQLLSTYVTFGCPSGEPTFRFSLTDGVPKYLVNPIVVDARTEITSQLLSDKGLAVHKVADGGEEIDEVFHEQHFERRFFNEETNVAMCKVLLENGLMDPATQMAGSQLYGKTIVFCVSQKHAARITNILNKLASQLWPDQYSQSDFAFQVTSHVADAQQMTLNFANNLLGGKVQNPAGYDSSKARVCVTVGMMTTGYDCPDILNLALMRPIFSPADFVQIKGRGTRKHRFVIEEEDISVEKARFKLFDFFASCEYFEKEFKYDEKIQLPIARKDQVGGQAEGDDGGAHEREPYGGPLDLNESDSVVSLAETPVGDQGMRIDREGFRRAVEEDVLGNETLKTLWQNGDVIEAENFAREHVLNQPKHFLTLDKIKKAFSLDRRVGIREFLQVAFGEKEGFETRAELLESEWVRFQEINLIDQEHVVPVRNFFKAYISDGEVREIIGRNTPADFNFCPSFDFQDYQRLNGYKQAVIDYVKDYVSLNTFMS